MSRGGGRSSTPSKVVVGGGFGASWPAIQQAQELPDRNAQAGGSPGPATLGATSPVISLGRNFLAATIPFSHAFEGSPGPSGSKTLVRSSTAIGSSPNVGTGLAAARALHNRRSLGSLLTECQATVPSPWPPGTEAAGATRAQRPRTRRLERQPVPEVRDVSTPLAEPTVEAGETQAEAQPQEQCPSTPDHPTGLTPASLKHLRRQRDSLASERERLLAEIARLQALARDQQAELEAEIRLREELQRQVQEAHELASQQVDIGAITAPLEESVRSREAEIAQLQQALEDERRKLEDACAAAAQAGEESERARADLGPIEERVEELEELVAHLRQDKQSLQREHDLRAQERDDWRRKAQEAEEAMESASQAHARFKEDMEKLRPDLVTKAIRSKIELHICVPRVALEYPDSPPVIVDMASGLSREHVRKFLQNKVFPQFDPLWMCLDGVDRAPDGTNKKAYTSRILELLTDRLKEFVDEFRCKMEADSGMTGPEEESYVAAPRSGSGRGRRPLQH